MSNSDKKDKGDKGRPLTDKDLEKIAGGVGTRTSSTSYSSSSRSGSSSSSYSASSSSSR